MNRYGGWILLSLSMALGLEVGAASADDRDRFFDQERFILTSEDGRYQLQSADRKLDVPLNWLEPPEAVREDAESYVGSLDWDEKVTSFPIGEDQIGLHLSSYTIASGGSAQAASGRDLLLIFQTKSGRLLRGLDLGSTKSRVNVGGCWIAHFDRIAVGDVDCDRRLDIAVVEESMSCEAPVDGSSDQDFVGPAQPFHRLSSRRWYRRTGEEWVHQSEYDDRLPCAGLQALPLISLAKGPVEFLLENYNSKSPLIDKSGRPVWGQQDEPDSR